jgi:Tol biopolymer transport system component
MGQDLEYPNWSRDGKYLYFESTGDNGPELFRVDVASRRLERIVSLNKNGDGE